MGDVRMHVKREDGLDRLLLPVYALALVLAAVCTYLVRRPGWVNVPIFAGFFLAWTAGVVVIWVVSIFLLSLTVDLSKPVTEDHPFSRKIVLGIIGLLCLVGRLRIHVTGWENIPEGRFLLVGNHRSGYDPIATVWALRQKGVDVAFITKPENMKIPLVRYIHMANFLVIDRQDARKAIQTIHAAADLIRRDVVSVGVYPEGTRSKTGEMLPFHNAVFKIAKQAASPMVVAYISGTDSIFQNLPWKHTDVTIDLRACLSAEEVAASSTKDLGERVRTILGLPAEA